MFVIPFWKVLPLASARPDKVVAPVAEYPTTGPGQLSPELTGAIPLTKALQVPGATFRVTFGGQTIVGFSESTIVTVKEQVAEFPEASVV